MTSYIFGTPGKSRETRTITAESLEAAVITFQTETIYPEVYVDKDMIAEVINDFGHTPGYTPILRAKQGAVYVFEDRILQKVWEVPVSDILTASLKPEECRLLEGPDDNGSGIVEAGQLPEYKNDNRRRVDELQEKRRAAELEAERLRNEIEAIQKELENRAKVLRLLKNYAGIDAEIVRIREGAAAPESTPLHVYQQKLYMDEAVGVFAAEHWDYRKNQPLDSLDVDSLEKFDEWIAEHFRTFMPAEKSLTVWQIRRSEKPYLNSVSPEAVFMNSILNSGNFHSYFLIRNGENLYHFTSDFAVPDAIFPTKSEIEHSSSSFGRSCAEMNTEKRLFALSALQGLIDNTDILGKRLRERRVNVLKPVGGFSDDDIVFVRDAEPDQFITDGRPRWKDYLKANQEGIRKGTRVMPIVSHWDIVKGSDGRNGWQAERSASERTRVYSTPEYGEVYTVNDIESCGYGIDAIKILFNPKDEVYRYQGDWISGHERMKRIGFLYYRDELIDIDSVSFEDIAYYLESRLDRPDYMSAMPVLLKLYRIKRIEHDEETPFAKLLADKAGLSWDSDEGRIRAVIRWWKTKNSIKRAVREDDVLAYRMCLRKLKESDDA